MSASTHKRFQRRPDGYSALRVYHRKGLGKRSPRLLVKCGDCDNALEIHYDPEHPEDMELGGVFGSMENWREILLPILSHSRATQKLVGKPSSGTRPATAP